MAVEGLDCVLGRVHLGVQDEAEAAGLPRHDVEHHLAAEDLAELGEELEEQLVADAAVEAGNEDVGAARVVRGLLLLLLMLLLLAGRAAGVGGHVEGAVLVEGLASVERGAAAGLGVVVELARGGVAAGALAVALLTAVEIHSAAAAEIVIVVDVIRRTVMITRVHHHATGNDGNLLLLLLL